MKINDRIRRAGFFTTQIYLQGRSLKELESLLGFAPGRLREGAIFAAATVLPPKEFFHFAGYSQVAAHHTDAKYGADLNAPENNEKEYYDKRKEEVMKKWDVTGSRRLIKVMPNIPHIPAVPPDIQYPPGRGIPQWKLIREIEWRVINIENNYPHGRFMPAEGMKKLNIFQNA